MLCTARRELGMQALAARVMNKMIRICGFTTDALLNLAIISHTVMIQRS